MVLQPDVLGLLQQRVDAAHEGREILACTWVRLEAAAGIDAAERGRRKLLNVAVVGAVEDLEEGLEQRRARDVAGVGGVDEHDVADEDHLVEQRVVVGALLEPEDGAEQDAHRVQHRLEAHDAGVLLEATLVAAIPGSLEGVGDSLECGAARGVNLSEAFGTGRSAKVGEQRGDAELL